MQISISDIWDAVKQIGYSVRMNNHDGLQMWGPIKEKYSKYTDTVYQIQSKHIEQFINYEKLDDTHDKVYLTIGNTKLDNSIAGDHFLIQHFRDRFTIFEGYILYAFDAISF